MAPKHIESTAPRAVSSVAGPRREGLTRTLQVSELGGVVGLGGGAGTTGRLVLRGSKKKRHSTLKRIILRERSTRLLSEARGMLLLAEQSLASLMAVASKLRAELDGAVEAATERRKQAGEELSGVLLPEVYTQVTPTRRAAPPYAIACPCGYCQQTLHTSLPHCLPCLCWMSGSLPAGNVSAASGLSVSTPGIDITPAHIPGIASQRQPPGTDLPAVPASVPRHL